MRVPRLQLPSGVPGLDEILGGGIPEGSCTVVGGAAGTGKTTLALQLAFANASDERPALYCSGAGEPPRKLQQHQEQLRYFDSQRVDHDVQLVDLGQHFDERDANRVLDTLECQVQFYQPSVAILDVPRTLTPGGLWTDMLMFLARCETTSVLITDGQRLDADLAPTLSVVDNILWLEHSDSGRTVQALKVRGQSPMPGAHAMQLSWSGIRVFPRWPTPQRRVMRTADRASTGVEGLDRLLGGGLPGGDSVLVYGPSGAGKSVLATHFVAEGGHQGLPGLVLLLEERPERFIERAENLDLQLERLIQGGLVEVLSLRGRDISADELIHLVQQAVLQLGARRVVVDSIAGLELLLGGSNAVRDCLWRLLDALSAAGVTVWLNQAPGGDTRLDVLVDDVLELKRGGRLELIKSSVAPVGTGQLAFQIGARGVQVVTQEHGSNGHANGHLVNYRFAG